jgi:hypothetical protein
MGLDQPSQRSYTASMRGIRVAPSGRLQVLLTVIAASSTATRIDYAIHAFREETAAPAGFWSQEGDVKDLRRSTAECDAELISGDDIRLTILVHNALVEVGGAI